jgi:hypothetical protein
MKTRPILAAWLLAASATAQAQSPLLAVDDPAGDDVGDGSVVYPRDSAYKRGDLDLRSLRVFADGKDLRFEATFLNPVRDPATVKAPGLSSETLERFSRHGFYSFNLDIYLDTDRVPGSGNTVTLPGRRAVIDPAHGWEKAIVLTPRPDLMQSQLIKALRESSRAGEAEVAATVERSVYFPTRVRVQGRTVSFTVPVSFVDAATVAGASMTAVVTAAKLSIDAGLDLAFGDTVGTRERYTLGAIRPEAGVPELALGYRDAPPPVTSVVDLLHPDPGQQARQLAPGGMLIGLNRDNRWGQAAVAVTAAVTPSTAPGASAPAAGGSSSWFSSAMAGLAGLFGAGTAGPETPAAPASTQSVQTLMLPPATPPAATAAQATAAPAAATPPAAPTPAPVAVPAPVRAQAPAAAAPAAPAAAPPSAPATAPPPAAPPPAAPLPAAPPAPAATPAATTGTAAVPAPQRPRDAAYFEEQEYRLRTLKRLFDAGLISAQEYEQKRREVLDKL